MAVCCAVCKKMRRVCSPEGCRVHKVIASGAVSNIEVEFLIDEVNADFIERGLYGLVNNGGHDLYLKSFLYEQDLRKKFSKLGSQGVNISLKAEIQQVKAKRLEVQALINIAQLQLDEANKIQDQAFNTLQDAVVLHEERRAEAPHSSDEKKSPSDQPAAHESNT